MSGKMSLSALLYFAANPGVSDDDVFARLTRGIRRAHPNLEENVKTSAEALSKKIAKKRRQLRSSKPEAI